MNCMRTNAIPSMCARDHDDVLNNKMATEYTQCLVQALLNGGADPTKMPLTRKGTPHKGSYPHHPIVRWVGESIHNFRWMFDLAWACNLQFEMRRGKEHFTKGQLDHILHTFVWSEYIPDVEATPQPRCFNQSKGENLDLLDEDKYTTEEAYRIFMKRDKARFARWECGIPAPDWWHEVKA